MAIVYVGFSMSSLKWIVELKYTHGQQNYRYFKAVFIFYYFTFVPNSIFYVIGIETIMADVASLDFVLDALSIL